MKERGQHLLSEVGKNIDYMRSDLRNLSRYIAELEASVSTAADTCAGQVNRGRPTVAGRKTGF
jgi:hypothetical protein